MEYFEDLADLLEEEREMDFDEIYEAIGDAKPEDMGEIVENYMEELLNGIPDDEQEIYLLVDKIKTALLFLCEELDDENTKNRFAEELCKFKNWYINQELCKIDGVPCSVMNAAASNRANKLTGGTSEFDFSGALDYELEDYSMPIGNFSSIDLKGRDVDDAGEQASKDPLVESTLSDIDTESEFYTGTVLM